MAAEVWLVQARLVQPCHVQAWFAWARPVRGWLVQARPVGRLGGRWVGGRANSDPTGVHSRPTTHPHPKSLSRAAGE